MGENILNLLNQLGASIVAQIDEANERANAIEAKHAHLISGLAALIGQPASNDNKADAKTTKTVLGGARVPARQSRSSISDDDFMAALTTEWQSATQLRAVITRRGLHFAEGTLYNRMRALAAKHSSSIETASKPERWRLKSKASATLDAASCTKVKSRFAEGVVTADTYPKSGTLPIAITDMQKGVTSPGTPNNIFEPAVHHGDCLDVMKTLPDDSVDLILADLPYGTTRLPIDERLNLDELWSEYRRILRKPHGNIVLFGSQPFTTALINAAPDIFRYSLVWDKNSSTGFQHAASKPLKKHEDILVFSYGVNISEKRTKRRATFNDQQAVPVMRKAKGRTKVTYLNKAIRGYPAGHEYIGWQGCQTSVLNFPKDTVMRGEKPHPFAKPLALLEHLIRTYSYEGEIVLDNTMGSGSTCIAAMRSGRRSIGIEKDRGWFDFAVRRVEAELGRVGFAQLAA